jgi:hypothetical protein
MSKTPTDLGIPLLTEVITAPEPAIEAPFVPAGESAAPAMPPRAHVVSEPAAPIDGWLDSEWTRIEQKIRERVLTQVLERVDTMIDQRIREGVADALQGAITRLTDELRAGLQQTLEDVITDAVAQEIERTRFTKN